MMIDVCSARYRATGGRITATSLRTFPTCRAVLRVITTVIASNNGGWRCAFPGAVNRRAFAAQWLMDGSAPAWGHRAWTCARRSVAGIGLLVSERRERRESSPLRRWRWPALPRRGVRGTRPVRVLSAPGFPDDALCRRRPGYRSQCGAAPKPRDPGRIARGCRTGVPAPNAGSPAEAGYAAALNPRFPVSLGPAEALPARASPPLIARIH